MTLEISLDTECRDTEDDDIATPAWALLKKTSFLAFSLLWALKNEIEILDNPFLEKLIFIYFWHLC